MDIKKGDTVEVISGKDCGRRGQILRSMPKEDRVVVEGINLRKKHSRKQTQTGSGRSIKGGTVEFPAPMHISNIMLVCPKCSKATRVSHSQTGKGARRVCRSCGVSIDG